MGKTKWLLIAGLTGAVAVGVSASSVARPTARLDRRPSSSAAAPALATALAQEVYSAHGQQARFKALLDVMRSLHVGVYTVHGKRLVRGAERTPRDFFLYDFELTMLARSLAARESLGLAELAHSFAAVGLKGSKPDDPEPLRRALVATVKQAITHPDDPGSLLPLLVRDLGLRHRPAYDLARNVPTARIHLDRLQSLLFTMGVLVPVIRELRSQSSSAALAPAVRAASVGECDVGPLGREVSGFLKPVINLAFLQKIAEELGIGGKFAKIVEAIDADLANLAGEALSAAAAAVILEKVIQMEILAYGVSYDLVDTPATQETHFGPPGHPAAFGQPGKELRFTVVVRMKSDLPKLLIDCGDLLGFKVPGPGPIEGVDIIWSQTGPQLQSLGSVSYQPESQMTGADGKSTLIYQPLEEAAPGFGTEYVFPRHTAVYGACDYVSARADYQSAFGQDNILTPGFWAQLWNNAESSCVRVGGHVPWGFKFSGVTFDWQSFGIYYTDYISGRVCAPSPYFDPAHLDLNHFPWYVTWTNTNNINPSNTGTLMLQEPIPGPGIEGLATSISPVPPGLPADWPDHVPRLTFLPNESGGTPRIQVERTLVEGQNQVAIVDVAEDKSCPEPNLAQLGQPLNGS